MTAEDTLAQATRYVTWLRRHWAAITGVALLGFVVAGWLVTYRLPLRADFSHLLPPDAPAVRDLHRLEARVSAQDTLLVLVEAQDPLARAAAAAALTERIRKLPSSLVARIEDDDAAARAFLREHRHLFVPLDDLVAARDALQSKLQRAKLEANPLYIEFDDASGDVAAANDKRLMELRAQRRAAEARLERSSYISADQTTQLIVVMTAFAKTDVRASRQLFDALAAERSVVNFERPDVEIGFAGGTVTTLAEHDALLRGVALSSVITAILVGLVLVLFFRSFRLLGLLGGVLVVATMVSFGIAVFTVGHLNAATAFLGAIIAGNGVNYGILLIARYREERYHHEPDVAMAHAIIGTLRPTLVASLAAAIAYGSLIATSFQGFADFAVIGSVGMLVCWIATYTLLPALVLRLAPHSRLGEGAPVIGSILVRLLALHHPRRVLAVAAVLAVGAGWVTYRYIASDPFEYNIKNLRSAGGDAIEARRWMAKSDAAFGRSIGGQTFIATESVEQVREVVAALARVDHPGQPPTIGTVRSIFDLAPDRQFEKLAVLGELRELIDDAAHAALSEAERSELIALRPPETLSMITPDELPAQLVDNLRERDGRLGLLVGVRPHPKLDEWNGKDLIRFASAVRRLEIGNGKTVTTSGSSVVFADIIAAIQHDGLRVTGIAAVGLVIMVLVVVGRNLRALSVLVAVFAGALGLVAACALLGMKVNFLDFVALPITLGLGVDYAINVAHRQASDHDVAATLRTSGSAVCVCSLTTIIGYGSLVVSDNLAIRGFGTASLIGEVCCLVTALVLVPAIVSLRKRYSGSELISA